MHVKHAIVLTQDELKEMLVGPISEMIGHGVSPSDIYIDISEESVEIHVDGAQVPLKNYALMPGASA